MKKPINILLVDDHPFVLEAYETSLNEMSRKKSSPNFNIQIAFDYDSALIKINESITKNSAIDIITLDISFNCTTNSKMLSGEDLGIKIKQLLPDIKILVCTSYNNNYRINTIIRNFNPLGILLKGDLNFKTFQTAVKSLIKNTSYYSKTVLELIHKKNSIDYTPDKIDRLILYELSIGTRMNALPNTLNMSMSGIEKRCRHLKVLFKINTSGNRELILKAKEFGFI